jgi:hypothetical protein
MNLQEKAPESSILEKDHIQEFITDRKIQPEDFHLIEKLAAFPKDLLIRELHNMFNSYKERSGRELKMCIEHAHSDEVRSLLETALTFYEKYDWAASWALIRNLEKKD